MEIDTVIDFQCIADSEMAGERESELAGLVYYFTNNAF